MALAERAALAAEGGYPSVAVSAALLIPARPTGRLTRRAGRDYPRQPSCPRTP